MDGRIAMPIVFAVAVMASLAYVVLAYSLEREYRVTIYRPDGSVHKSELVYASSAVRAVMRMRSAYGDLRSAWHIEAERTFVEDLE
jgi:hypothetical protein